MSLPATLAHALTLKASMVLTEVVVASGIALAGLLPGLDAENEMMWVWRGFIVASLALNLHTLRRVYQKVSLVGTHTTQIATITVAIEYLAQDAIDHGAGRSGDRLILQLMEQVKKLQPPPDRE